MIDLEPFLKCYSRHGRLLFFSRVEKACPNAKRGHGANRNPLLFMVGTTGFEPATSTVSG